MTASDSNSKNVRRELPADDVVDVRGALTDLDEQALESRRATLLSMLNSSLARYDSVMSRRLPSLAPGVKIRITRGSLKGTRCVVKEADYIAERALVKPDNGQAQWITFNALGPA